jgi:hypothetical protein
LAASKRLEARPAALLDTDVIPKYEVFQGETKKQRTLSNG